MKKYIYLFISLSFIIMLLMSCTDDIAKIQQIVQKVRIEYSACSGCLECVEDFNCPQDAIEIDERTGTTYINGEKCTECMQCINNFSCPENAITLKIDNISPGNIADFSAVSDTFGKLEIQFIAPGDDDTLGLVYRYELTLKDQNEQTIQTDFEAPLPHFAGIEENWILNDLPPEELITVNLQAFDELNQFSETVSCDVLIQGEYHDEIPPAAITDLISNSFEDSLELIWTAVGDDSLDGSANRYEIRYSENEIDDSNWNAASEYFQNLIPSQSGILEYFYIDDLPPQINYYFAIKVFDEEDNDSEISNNTTAAIIGDIVPPADINDLTIISASYNSIQLNWTAVGDNGNEGFAAEYVIKVHTENITEENWGEIPEIEQTISPQIAGSTESFLITELESVTMYYAAVKVLDEAQNISNLSNVVNDQTTEIPDETPPGQISDLAALPTEDIIILTWTAVGDDGMEGQAAFYEIRFSDAEITEENWSEASLLPNPPQPSFSGTSETYVAYDLTPGINYFFAIKAIDESLNSSGISNNAQAEIFLDEIPPAAITDLVVLDEFSIPSYRMKIRWNAPGDDDNEGTASYYDIRYATFPIEEFTWDFATQFADPPDPESAGTQQTCEISGLDGGTIYYFAIKTYDDNDNESEISNSPGGKIVYQINHGACHDCGQCINDCPEGAISDVGPYKTIDPDICDACGICSCPWNLIRLSVVSY